jgi:hypothetical protein
MFEKRNILIVSKHKKEEVISPFFAKYFNSNCFVSNHFDTDILGTFCGEIDRKEDPISTLRKKCIMGLENSSFDIAIGSEGSFGSHPMIFFAAYSEEYMMIYDKKNQIEIIAKESTTNTNFNEKVVSDIEELLIFAKEAKFPSHGLILKSIEGETIIKKGIIELNELKSAFNELKKINKDILVLTDMRAMFNPTRMKILKKLTLKLIKKIKSTCKKCNYPGFDVAEVKKGLPCEACNLPTDSTLSYINKCNNCLYEEIQWFPNKKKYEDPMYCNFCNP